jgi:hypothetical protein
MDTPMTNELLCIAVLGFVAIAAVGIVGIVAIVFGRGFRGEITRDRLTIETQAGKPGGVGATSPANQMAKPQMPR